MIEGGGGGRQRRVAMQHHHAHTRQCMRALMHTLCAAAQWARQHGTPGCATSAAHRAAGRHLSRAPARAGQLPSPRTFMYRPAWRIIHTGGRSTASPRMARSMSGSAAVPLDAALGADAAGAAAWATTGARRLPAACARQEIGGYMR